MKKILPLLLLPLLLVSCSKALDVEEPAERDLVLNAVPAAGRQAFVHFSYTRFFLDNNNDQPVPGAQVHLSVNGVPLTLDSVVRCRYYFDRVLQEDDSLDIDILAAGRTVHASTYVPLYPQVSAFMSTYLATSTFNFVLAAFNLTDHAGRDEYYNITVTERDSGARRNEWTGLLDTVDTVQSAMLYVPGSEEITASDVAAYSPLGGRLMFLDRNIDGQKYPVRLMLLYRKDTTEVAPFKHEYTVEIESVTPARFRYLLSASSQGGMTSFFAEQGSVYGNVDGALGIFAGSAKHTFTFDLESLLPTSSSVPLPDVLSVFPQLDERTKRE